MTKDTSKEEWILTDDDSCQYRREINTDHGKLFELYQIQLAANMISDTDSIYSIAHDFISVLEINVDSVLSCYGYDSLDQVKSEYGSDWEAILAECQFELDAGCQENLIAHMPLMTWLEAKHVIETLVEKEGK